MERNRGFAKSVNLAMLQMGDRANMPDRILLLLTCVDPRVEPAGVLGLQLGEAGVLRNVGGRVDQRVVEDMAYLAMRLGTRLDIAVIHHTQCGSGMLSEGAFRRSFAELVGLDDADLAAKAVTDPAETVRHDVEKLLTSSLLSSALVASVSGHALHLETGLVETVVEATTVA
ncbi:carbonic anhydrase [Streptomyces galilaeus]